MSAFDDVFVGIPWRDTGDPYRKRNVDYVSQYLADITGRVVKGLDGETPTQAFSLPAARNAVVNEARRWGTPKVIICDADTIPSKESLEEAVRQVDDDGIILPFDLYRALSDRDSQRLIAGADPDTLPDIGTLDWSVGGVCVTTISGWDALGGQDERFTGWGCEDIAFSLVATALGRPLRRVNGTIHHLWHPRAVNPSDASYKANERLLQEYADASDIAEIVRQHNPNWNG